MVWIIVISLLVAIGRFLIPGHDLSWPGTYEAFAHIWVGLLIGMCIGSVRLGTWRVAICQVPFWCLVSITVLETVMFVIRDPLRRIP